MKSLLPNLWPRWNSPNFTELYGGKIRWISLWRSHLTFASFGFWLTFRPLVDPIASGLELLPLRPKRRKRWRSTSWAPEMINEDCVIKIGFGFFSANSIFCLLSWNRVRFSARVFKNQKKLTEQLTENFDQNNSTETQ